MLHLDLRSPDEVRLRYALFLACLPLFMWGQEFHFEHYAFPQENSAVKGMAMCFGPHRELLIATDGDLYAFTGQEYYSIPTGGHTRTANEITSVYVSGSSIWLGYRDGSVVRGTGRNTEVCPVLSGSPIRDIASLGQRIVAATYGTGLILACPANQASSDWTFPSNDLYDLQTDQAGKLWVASDAGISILDTNGIVRHLGSDEGISDEINISLTMSPDGLIWAGSFEHGICLIDSSFSIEYPFPDWNYGPVRAMAATNDLELWIATEQNGLLNFDRVRKTIKQVLLPGNSTPAIVDIEFDQEGNLWILDTYSGLYKTNRHFESYPVSLMGIQALMFDHTSQLYAGNTDGLYKVNIDGEFTTEKVLDNINVISLYEDQRRQIWVGTFGQGLFHKPHNSREWLQYRKENGLTDESILSIAGIEDTLWLATLGGVTKIVISEPANEFRLKSTNYNLADGLGTNFIYTAFADSQGRIWFGTDGKGLSVLEPGGTIHNYQEADTIPLHSVYSITEDRAGRICFVTDRDGVFRFDGGYFEQLPQAIEPSSGEITNIIADPFGDILVAHNAGVDRITENGMIIRYRGKESEPFNPNLNAFFQDSLGGIWIAGQHSILKYNPLGGLRKNAPQNILREVSVFLTPINFEDQNTFKATENYLTFKYLGLWYTNPKDVIYRFKLDGLDPDWTETREQSVTYQNIPAGDYTFILNSSVSGRFDSNNIIRYSFRVERPFYQTLPFIAFATIAIALIIYVALRLREQRINRAAALQRQQIESQLQTLKAQINPHFLFNSFNTLVSVIEEDKDSAVEYVEHLSDFYRSILQYREKTLIPLREEIEIIRTYSYILMKRYGSALSIDIEDAWPDAWVVPLVLQILVENAVKHNIIAEHKPLVVRIGSHGDGSVIVENTFQKRQVVENSTGFGLQSITDRYRMLTDTPIEVGKDHDRFYVIIPLLKHDEIPDHRR